MLKDICPYGKMRGVYDYGRGIIDAPDRPWLAQAGTLHFSDVPCQIHLILPSPRSLSISLTAHLAIFKRFGCCPATCKSAGFFYLKLPFSEKS
jgi:hypothetical protein